MKQHDIPAPGGHRRRRIAGHAQDDHVVDTYKARKKLPEPTVCPNCGAVYQEGRWQWPTVTPAQAHEELCSACHRINDKYPAGTLTLSGAAVRKHKAEMLGLARNAEAAEKAEHPLNRIMAVEEEGPETLTITTTDIHLPRRIGEAVHKAFHGDLQVHYDQENYFVRVNWQQGG